MNSPFVTNSSLRQAEFSTPLESETGLIGSADTDASWRIREPGIVEEIHSGETVPVPDVKLFAAFPVFLAPESAARPIIAEFEAGLKEGVNIFDPLCTVPWTLVRNERGL